MEEWWNSLSAKGKVFVLGICSLILACLFPPWVLTYKGFYGVSSAKPLGFYFILSPPDVKYPNWGFGVEINAKLLLIECFIIILVTILAMLFVKD